MNNKLTRLDRLQTLNLSGLPRRLVYQEGLIERILSAEDGCTKALMALHKDFLPWINLEAIARPDSAPVFEESVAELPLAKLFFRLVDHRYFTEPLREAMSRPDFGDQAIQVLLRVFPPPVQAV